ncbi:hypothetical protein [Streptomyces cyaneofuscatus]|uniref:hypothetical protein n=1 Tax=Streptomyces cyaneofuscatus TaxID=66883 RepID=UPI0037A378AC
MTDYTPPDGGKPGTPFRDKAKDWVEKGKGWAEKHPRTIRFIEVAGVAAGMIAVVVLAPRSMDEDAGEFASYAEGSSKAEDVGGTAEVEGVAGQQQPSAPDGTENRRDSAKNHLRTLHPGWNASKEKQAQYKEETGEDLPAGTTWVSPKSDADDAPEAGAPGADDSPENEDWGEAAA